MRTYEEFGRKFAPDMVIFGWNATDLADNVRSDLYRLKNGQLVVGNPAYLPSIEIQNFLMRSSAYRWIADDSDLYSLLRERGGLAARRLLAKVNQYWLSLGTTIARDQGVRGAEISQYPVALATALLQKSMMEVEQDNADFVVVDIPDRLSPTTFESSFGPISHNLPELKAVTPLDAFRAYAIPELYYEHGEGHLTPRAVAIVVGLTADAISKSPKLAGCSTE
jgi:hypothetical protein